jgi:hypothetical protein
MQISAQYQLTQAEVRRAHWRVAPLLQTGPFLVALVLPAFQLAAGLQIAGRVRFDDGLLISLVFGLLAGVAMLPRQLAGYARQAVPSAVTITGNRVMRALPTATADVEWHRFVKTVSTPDLWLLYTTKNSALIIPKRVFTPEQQHEIEALVRR